MGILSCSHFPLFLDIRYVNFSKKILKIMSLSTNIHCDYMCDPLGPYISLVNNFLVNLSVIGALGGAFVTSLAIVASVIVISLKGVDARCTNREMCVHASLNANVVPSSGTDGVSIKGSKVLSGVGGAVVHSLSISNSVSVVCTKGVNTACTNGEACAHASPKTLYIMR